MIDKDEVRNSLTLENIYDFLEEWGGEPQYTSFGITSCTICHNPAGEGKRKLYYYENSGLFKCYTECDSTFDIFELLSKVMKIQKNLDYGFYKSISWIIQRFNLAFSIKANPEIDLPDWKVFENYTRIKHISPTEKTMPLKPYNKAILKNFNYNIKIDPWLKEGITTKAMRDAQIGFYPGQDCITIPHFDFKGNLIGIRGRTLGIQEAEMYGKYRPLKINNILYSHPLGLNLYGLNWAKDNIRNMETAIIVESEKSHLLYNSYFGRENNIVVACCGSSISKYQMNLLLSLGVKEVVIAFDRQFQKIGDSEFVLLKNKLIHIHERYKNYTNISIIFDKKRITSYKAGPLDEGPEKFL